MTSQNKSISIDSDYTRVINMLEKAKIPYLTCGNARYFGTSGSMNKPKLEDCYSIEVERGYDGFSTTMYFDVEGNFYDMGAFE